MGDMHAYVVASVGSPKDFSIDAFLIASVYIHYISSILF
jgi:hypothetical protein